MDRSNNYTRFYNKFYICLYSVIFAGGAFAQQAPSNTNIAGPQASATGNVTNQAVQVLQGPYATNTYGSGISCQGPSLSIAPFVIGSANGSKDPEQYQSYSGSGGFSLGFNIPLDGSLQELCKARVRTEISRQESEVAKSRLDFELVRLIKCGEAKKSGVDFHPNSPYAKICADIIIQPPKIVTIDPVNSINTKLPQQSNVQVGK